MQDGYTEHFRQHCIMEVTAAIAEGAMRAAGFVAVLASPAVWPLVERFDIERFSDFSAR